MGAAVGVDVLDSSLNSGDDLDSHGLVRVLGAHRLSGGKAELGRGLRATIEGDAGILEGLDELLSLAVLDQILVKEDSLASIASGGIVELSIDGDLDGLNYTYTLCMSQ